MSEIKEHEFTAVFLKRGEWYVAYVEELPGVNTQGRTLEEARKNLMEALRLILQANRELTAELVADKQVIREQLRVKWGRRLTDEAAKVAAAPYETMDAEFYVKAGGIQ